MREDCSSRSSMMKAIKKHCGANAPRCKSSRSAELLGHPVGKQKLRLDHNSIKCAHQLHSRREQPLRTSLRRIRSSRNQSCSLSGPREGGSHAMHGGLRIFGTGPRPSVWKAVSLQRSGKSRPNIPRRRRLSVRLPTPICEMQIHTAARLRGSNHRD